MLLDIVWSTHFEFEKKKLLVSHQHLISSKPLSEFIGIVIGSEKSLQQTQFSKSSASELFTPMFRMVHFVLRHMPLLSRF